MDVQASEKLQELSKFTPPPMTEVIFENDIGRGRSIKCENLPTLEPHRPPLGRSQKPRPPPQKRSIPDIQLDTKQLLEKGAAPRPLRYHHSPTFKIQSPIIELRQVRKDPQDRPCIAQKSLVMEEPSSTEIVQHTRDQHVQEILGPRMASANWLAGYLNDNNSNKISATTQWFDSYKKKNSERRLPTLPLMARSAAPAHKKCVDFPKMAPYKARHANDLEEIVEARQNPALLLPSLHKKKKRKKRRRLNKEKRAVARSEKKIASGFWNALEVPLEDYE